MDSNSRHSSTATLDGRTISVEDFSRLLYTGPLNRYPGYHDLPSTWSPMPPPSPLVPVHYGPVSVVASTPLLVPPSIPEPDYEADDSSMEGNSDSTLDIAHQRRGPATSDVVIYFPSDESLNSEDKLFFSQIENSSRRWVPGAVESAVGYCKSTQQILWPPKLAELAIRMEQSPNSHRIFLPENPASQLESSHRCSFAYQCLSWIFAFLTIMTFLVCIDSLYPGSPAVYVCIVALVFLVVGGIVNCIPFGSWSLRNYF